MQLLILAVYVIIKIHPFSKVMAVLYHGINVQSLVGGIARILKKDQTALL